jgi:hypothetical protein
VEVATKSYRSGYGGLILVWRINIKRYLLEHQDVYNSLYEAYKIAQRFEVIENAIGEEKQEFFQQP